MATIKVQAQGVSTEVQVENANVQEVLDVFERMTNKSLKGTEAYVNGSKAGEDTSVSDGDRVTFIQAKHASAAKIKVQAAGMSTEVEISDDCNNLDEILETFERLTRKSLKGMDAFVNGQPMKEGYEFQDQDRVAFSQSKHASAAKIKVQAAGMSTEVEISDDCGNLDEILETFERLTKKSLKGMDAFVNGKPMEEGYEFQDQDRVAFSQSKHASAK